MHRGPRNAESPSSPGAFLKHRTDIDGLRGLAVLAVFAGHLGLSGAPGGFVGVDVFFVVSGFVIARVVAHRHAEGRFSLVDFWERRTRRLMPAVLVVIAATTAMACFHMFPDELTSFAGSSLSTLAFAANLWFWQTISYFAAPPDMHPLLHAWSLGVEEQFYIVFPLLMAAGWRWFPKALKPVLGLLALASFAIGVWWARDHVSADFYLPVSRAWELLLGVLLSLGAIPTPKDRRVRATMGAAGLAMILWAMATYQPWTVMPGTAALLPCLGALLLLAAGEDTPTGALLSIPPLRFYGAISYSLYLWHWPLISFQRMLYGQQTGAEGAVAVFILAVVLATLSWRFIETPVRDRRDGLSTGRFYLVALAATLLVAAPSVAILATGGLPARFSPRVYAIATSAVRTERRQEACLPSPDGPLSDWPAGCLDRAADRPNWLLMGDSHANHLWFGLSQAHPDINLMQATVSNCRMTIAPADGATAQCRRLADRLFGEILSKTPPERVYLAGLWRPGDEAAVAETLAWLKAHGIEAILIGPAPTYEQSVPRLLALAEHLGQPDLPLHRRLYDADRMEPKMQAVARAADVPYLSILRAICPRGVCELTTPNGRPMQWDEGHLSRDGSRLVGERLKAQESAR
ncbi:MAG: acyltransferase family protein [Caulobacter sp.]|nr:acyltransferase family protein [Caulobacter sp.]